MTGVALGSALLTLVDPERGAEVEFNRWYERDHLYAGALLGPGVFAGCRYVARAAEKAQRRTDGDPNRGSMLALYWLVGDGADYWSWSSENVRELIAAGRMSPQGRVRSALALQRPWAQHRDPDGVPVEVALDRRFPALLLVMLDAEPGASVTELAAWYRSACVEPTLAGSGAALTVGFEPRPIDVTTGTPAVDGPAQVVALWFLDSDDPAGTAQLIEAHEKAMSGSAYGHTAYLSPFVVTVPGTDQHLDALWL